MREGNGPQGWREMFIWLWDSLIWFHIAVNLKLFHLTSEWLFPQRQLWTDDQTCVRQAELQDYIFQGKHTHTHTHTNACTHSPTLTFAHLTVKAWFNLPSAVRLSGQGHLLVPLKLRAHAEAIFTAEFYCWLTGLLTPWHTTRDLGDCARLISCWCLDDCKLQPSSHARFSTDDEEERGGERAAAEEVSRHSCVYSEALCISYFNFWPLSLFCSSASVRIASKKFESNTVR